MTDVEGIPPGTSTFIICAAGVATLGVIHLLAVEIIPKLWKRRKPFHALLFCAGFAEICLLSGEFARTMVDASHRADIIHKQHDEAFDESYYLQFEVFLGVLFTIRTTALPFRVLAQLFRAKAVVFSKFSNWLVKIAIGTTASLLIGRAATELSFRRSGPVFPASVIAATIMQLLLRVVAIAADAFFIYQYIKVRHHAMQRRETLRTISGMQYDHYSHVATASGSTWSDETDCEKSSLFATPVQHLEPPPAYRRRSSISSNIIPATLKPKYWVEQTHRQAERIHAPISLLALLLLQIVLEVLQLIGFTLDFIDFWTSRNGLGGVVIYFLALSETTFIISLSCVTCVNDKIASLAQAQDRQRQIGSTCAEDAKAFK